MNSTFINGRGWVVRLCCVENIMIDFLADKLVATISNNMESHQEPRRLPLDSIPLENMAANSHHPYDVDDISTDPIQLTDSWGKFMSLRFRQRQTFYQELDATEKQLVRKEVHRIQFFRDYFNGRKLLESDAKSLVTLLEDSRTAWNTRAFEDCGSKLSGEAISPRDRLVLEAVQRRGGKQRSEGELPASTTEDDTDLTNYKPDEPDYGYNGWLMAFENGKERKNDRRCCGEFPHQKISIRKLLYNKSDTPLTRTDNKNELRYFHLPANNMAWVEASGLNAIALEASDTIYNRKPSRNTMTKRSCISTATEC